MVIIMSCETCKYCIHGSCHRFPPVLEPPHAYGKNEHWRYPRVGTHDWCGEYKPRAEAD